MRHLEQRTQVGIVSVSYQRAVARDQTNEILEGGFDGLEIRKNIGMVKFQVIDNGNFRQVMNELAAFVEKSGVVLVAFYNEPVALREARSLAEVVGNAADEITG